MTKDKLNIRWKRLAWDIFIFLYCSLFFYNCLSPFSHWVIPYIYTIILILWLEIEYYETKLFFQSGYVPIEVFATGLRAGFALFFYSSFVIGIITIVGWPNVQIGLYPVINIMGILVLLYSIYLRRVTRRSKIKVDNKISQFYLSIVLMLISLGLGYGSYFLIIYAAIVGLPIIFFECRFEKKEINNFEWMLQKKNIARLNEENYMRLWQKYIERRVKKKRRK